MTLAVLGLMTACANPLSVSSIAADTDFSSYETFHVVAVVQEPNPLTRMLEEDIIDQLIAKGYRAIEPQQADLIVLFQGQALRKQRATHGDFFGGCCVIEEYVKGTAEIDFHTRHDGQRIWRGVARVDLPSARTLDVEASRAVAAILDEFPDRGDRD